MTYPTLLSQVIPHDAPATETFEYWFAQCYNGRPTMECAQEAWRIAENALQKVRVESFEEGRIVALTHAKAIVDTNRKTPSVKRASAAIQERIDRLAKNEKGGDEK